MNRCGIRRFDKHRQTSERPTDPVLHQEQQQRLSALLQERNAQDKGMFPVSTGVIESISKDTEQKEIAPTQDPSHYTPWKTPSTN